MAGTIAVPSRSDAVPSRPVTGRRGLGAGGAVQTNYGAGSVVGTPRYQPFMADEEASRPGGSLTYARPTYDNAYAAEHNSEVVDFNPYTSTVYESSTPAYPVPTSVKRIDVGTERREFGSWSQSYPHGAPVNTGLNQRLVAYGPLYARPTIQVSANPRLPFQPSAHLRSLGNRVQMTGPYYPLLTQKGPSTSYGSMTTVLSSPYQGGSVFGS